MSIIQNISWKHKTKSWFIRHFMLLYQHEHWQNSILPGLLLRVKNFDIVLELVWLAPRRLPDPTSAPVSGIRPKSSKVYAGRATLFFPEVGGRSQKWQDPRESCKTHRTQASAARSPVVRDINVNQHLPAVGKQMGRGRQDDRQNYWQVMKFMILSTQALRSRRLQPWRE